MTVCIDASLIIKCLTYEPDSDKAIDWLSTHKDEEMVAPAFFLAEVASVIRQKVRQDELTLDEAQEAFDALESLDVRLLLDFALMRRAFDLAAELDQPTIYDMLYLAVAEREHCDLWTSDARFVSTARSRYPFVQSVASG